MMKNKMVMLVGAASLLMGMALAGEARSKGSSIAALMTVAHQNAARGKQDATSSAQKARQQLKKASKAKQAHLRKLATVNERHARNYAAIAKKLEAAKLKLAMMKCK